MNFKKVVSALLATAVFSSFNISAANLGGLGNVYYQVSETLSPGLEFTEMHTHDGSQYQHAFKFEYTPGMGTLPIVAYGSEIAAKSTLGNMINEKINQGNDIVGGINGDFFSFATGVPMSAVAVDGRLLSSCDDRAALGITYDGHAIIGKPAITMSLDIGKRSLPIDHLNKYPSIYAVYLLTEDYGNSTETENESLEIVLSLSSDNIGLNSSVSAKVTEIRRNSKDSKIPSDCAVIVVNENNKNYDAYSRLEVGDSLTLETKSSDTWSNISHIIGGSDIILENGYFNSALVDEDHEKYANPRSCAGITADGKVIFFAVDGRNSGYSSGLKLSQLADTLKAMGCVTAINLDGGGSTTVAIKSTDDGKIYTVNRPTDGTQRKISNAVLFANSIPQTGIPSYIKITPASPYVLCGGSFDIEITLFDTSARKMDYDFTDSVTYSVSPDAGSITKKGIFTASGNVGSYTLTAIAEINDSVYTATAEIKIISELTGLEISAEYGQIPSGSPTALLATGYYMTVPVYASASSFEWNFSSESIENSSGKIAACEEGYINDSGVFYAASDIFGRELTLTATYNNVSASTVIGIGMVSDLLQNFESKPNVFSTKNTDISYVENGYKSETALKFTGEALEYTNGKRLEYAAQSLKLWCYEDIGNSNLFVSITDADGIDRKLLWEIDEDYSKVSGWILLSAEISRDISQPITVNSIISAEEEHTFIIDDFQMYYGNNSSVFADMADSWAIEYVNSAYNMGILDGEFDEDGNRIYNPDRHLTRSEFAKLIACFCRLDLDKYKDITLTYSDADEIAEWAIPYVKAVTGSGIMGGLPGVDGNVFAGGEYITRADVMYVLGSLLTPLDGISNTTFTDSDSIPSWAYENIQITESCNIIKGYEDNTLRPAGNITRAEIATVFTRMSDSDYYIPKY